MKKIVFMAMVILGVSVYAQEVKPNFEKKGEVIKGTYYYDNGEVKQEGTYNKEGKLHGEWIMYNAEGDKTAIGNYEKGVKTGKWFFWKKDELVEVDYANNQIADVTNWQSSNTIAVSE
ncbi:toxin-antitoxin system YwqK family antitoxin [Mesonia aestuariivivens]|uniref:Nicotinic acid mononucleotide adenyltransferase n=1 Tax=Mesonia aestuariivivens TaxID=2796128 RepID=A0ABS6W243_9FLAO|nr:nicotinic acid mononucleotide adenyltransferase [Mesonia aestuariivivens]MBW2961921.1 nicotinic acid mononucleotide adenyltransferase [Mesonia aestuariivivens]